MAQPQSWSRGSVQHLAPPNPGLGVHIMPGIKGSQSCPLVTDPGTLYFSRKKPAKQGAAGAAPPCSALVGRARSQAPACRHPPPPAPAVPDTPRSEGPVLIPPPCCRELCSSCPLREHQVPSGPLPGQCPAPPITVYNASSQPRAQSRSGHTRQLVMARCRAGHVSTWYKRCKPSCPLHGSTVLPARHPPGAPRPGPGIHR